MVNTKKHKLTYRYLVQICQLLVQFLTQRLISDTLLEILLSNENNLV